MEDLLRPGERLDDLLFNGLKIIQNPSSYCFGCDAVELAEFVKGDGRDVAFDLGSGSGIITILLAAKKGIHCTGVEVQPEQADRSRRSIRLNGLEDKCDVLTAPMQRVCDYFAAGSASIVVTNPPYEPVGHGFTQRIDVIAIARHELTVTLTDVADSAKYLLKNGGALYMIHKASRLAEVFSVLRERKLEPKILQLLTPAEGRAPHLFMVKCVKYGKSGLKILPARVVNTIV